MLQMREQRYRADVSAAAVLLKEPQGLSVHLLGIGGIGMAGLAILLQDIGCCVSGCDTCENSLIQRLRARGVNVQQGHDPDHIRFACDAVIRSTAVPEHLPECVEAKDRGIPVFHRGPVLAALMNSRPSVAVTGTHGKTTTTAMLVHLLQSAGASPGYFIGGEPFDETLPAYGSDKSAWWAAEADESDGSVICYAPEYSILTNLEYDHMEHFGNEETLFACVRTLIAQTKKSVLYSGDDPILKKLSEGVSDAVSFGLGNDCIYRADTIVLGAGTAEFSLRKAGEDKGRVALSVPGEFNVRNALGALALIDLIGESLELAVQAMRSFRPVRRRYERMGTWCAAQMISDYAHHPTELRAVVQAALHEKPNRIVCLFQPHRYTRTLALKEQFAKAFEGVDLLVLLPVYPASETPLPGGMIEDLFETMQMQLKKCTIEMVADCEQAEGLLQKDLKPGDLLLVLGAGDVIRFFEVINAKGRSLDENN